MPPVRGDGSLRAIKLENERRVQEFEDIMRVQKEWTGTSEFQLRPKDAELANGEFFSRDIEVSVEVFTSEVMDAPPHRPAFSPLHSPTNSPP